MLSGPLYYPEDKILHFKNDEVIENIRSNLAGKNLLYEDPGFYYFIKGVERATKGVLEAVEWRRPKEICKSPKFIDGKPRKSDALQGKVGNCWAISAMEALTLQPTLIKHVIPHDQSFDENYIGAFHFRIWSLGHWYDVIVDDRLPVYQKDKNLCFCTSRRGNVFWASLLEKAYAKFWVTDDVSYEVLASGSLTTSFLNFTGGIVEIICANEDYQNKYGYLPSGTTLKTLLYEAHKKDALMSGVCCSRMTEASKLGMIPGHGYTITRIFQAPDEDPEFSYNGLGLFLVRVLNPWGHFEFKENWSDDERYGGPWKTMWRKIDRFIHDEIKDDTKDDGEFWMNDINFEKHFGLVHICHLGPGEYAETRNYDINCSTWKTIFFRGEWVKGVSAAGSNPEERHKLPQYGIELKPSENTIANTNVSYVVIHLTHKAKYRMYKKCPKEDHCIQNNLGLYIYDTTDETMLQETRERFGKEFFKEYEPLNDEPIWKAGDARSYTLGLFLQPGTYCIVPCTQHADMNSQYLLRVFSTSDVDDWKFDTNISKKLQTEDENPNYTDTSVHTMFIDIAEGQNEIDWSGLKRIFDAAFNSSLPYFGIFTYISNYIFSIFGMFPSTRSYNDCRNENVDFTKDQCRAMIAMLDNNHSGKLEFSEFSELWNKINFWIKVFNQHIDETTGLLQVDQLKDALGAIGYDISTRAVHSLSYIYADDEGMILLTDFVLCGVALESALSCFEEETLKSGTKFTLSLEEWVKSTLIL